MKQPLSKPIRIVAIVGAAAQLILSIAVFVTGGSGWGAAAVLVPAMFLAGYVARDIDVRKPDRRAK